MTDVRSFVPAARPVFGEGDRRQITDLIDHALSTGSLTLGPLTERFEADVAAWSGRRFAVAVASGTAALEIALRAVDISARGVVVPTNTFFATAAAVLHAGGRPQLADVDARTLALSVDTVSAAITDDTTAVVMVHIGGVVSPETPAVRDLCAQRGLTFIEDAAHAHGADFDGQPAGSFGAAGTLSFYPTKVITSGEGGMVLTDDERIRDEAVIYRDQGKAGFFGGEHVRLGYAWRMSELHAAVGVTQWARLEEFLAARRRAAAIYDEALRGVDGIEVLTPPEGSASNYYKYVALLEPGLDRVEVKRRLREEHGVAMSGEVYARPLHREPVFEGLAERSFPVADDVCARQVCLPVHSDMTEAEAAQVADAVIAVMSSR